ncbi:MAG: 5'/3'-nucleotidase SurE, partial [Melioribacteraceae bacterium]|nr:5'/3'-nucleotidase SurE [Melioribacteraceae bacterium]
PDLPEEEIKGIMMTKQGKSKWDDVYEERQDPYGKNYYWLTGNMINLDKDLDKDHFAIENDYVAITPIHFDLTDYEMYDRMKSWNVENILKNDEQ